MMPQRIQRKRSAGWRMPENTVYVGRPSEFGNPFVVGEYRMHPLQHLGRVQVRDNHHAMVLFDYWLDVTEDGKSMLASARNKLRGKSLACWCAPGEPCHADVLLRQMTDGRR